KVNNLRDPVASTGANDGVATSFVRSSVTPLTPPGIISSGLPGGLGRPVLLGGDFGSNYIFENAANITAATKAYLPGSTGASRGSICFIPYVFNLVAGGASNAGTGAFLARTDSNTKTRGIQIFGVNTDGSLDNQVQIVLPTTSGQVVDPVDGYNPV